MYRIASRTARGWRAGVSGTLPEMVALADARAKMAAMSPHYSGGVVRVEEVATGRVVSDAEMAATR